MALPRPPRTSGDRAPGGPHRSLWLRQALGDARPEPPLRGSTRADVVIAGGGFVGLWTALRIKELDPGCDVVVLERDVCGGGASGRNGGMALSWWPKLASLVQLCGREEAVRLARASEDAVAEIERFAVDHDLDVELRRGGLLWAATSPAQAGAWETVLRLCDGLGVAPFERLAPGEVARRTGSAVHRDAVIEARSAMLHPGRLVRALRAVALRRGVRMHEGTEVTGFTRERPLRVDTDAGAVAAERLVLATNAWAQSVPELRRRFVTVSSDVVATPPIPGRLEALGWGGEEGITDSQSMVNYYRRTVDGRLVFGKGTGGLRLGHRLGAAMDHDAARAALVESEMRRYYPMLDDVPIESAWGGPIDRTWTSLPLLGHLEGAQHVVYGVGWSGNGVAPSVLGGRVLAALALSHRDEWSASTMVDAHHRRFPPEPLRFAAGRLVRRSVVRKELAEAVGRPPRARDVRIAALAPAGLEDK